MTAVKNNRKLRGVSTLSSVAPTMDANEAFAQRARTIGMKPLANRIRFVSCKDGSRRFVPGKSLRPTISSAGYHKIHFRGDKRSVISLVHRLVAAAFIPNPHGLPEVNHIDCDRLNNTVVNLEWCDRLGNMRHAVSLGRAARGETHGNSKFTAALVRAIRESPLSNHECARKFGVSPSHVSGLRSYRFWRHV